MLQMNKYSKIRKFYRQNTKNFLKLQIYKKLHCLSENDKLTRHKHYYFFKDILKLIIMDRDVVYEVVAYDFSDSALIKSKKYLLETKRSYNKNCGLNELHT